MPKLVAMSTNNKAYFNKGLFLVFTLTLIASCVGIYYSSLQNIFLSWGDNLFVTDNPIITAFSLENLKTIFLSKKQLLYIPMTMLSFQLEFHFFGLEPFIYHLSNLILHSLNCLLILWGVYLICKKQWIAFVTALIFAVHPLHVETVSWVSQRTELLSTFFFLCALISYIHFRESRKLTTYLFCFILFIFAILSKPIAIMFPLIMLLIDFKIPKKYREKYFLEKIPFFIISIYFGIMALSLQQSAAFSTLSIWERLLVGTQTLTFYLEKLILPTNLSAMYPFPETIAWLSPEFLMPILLFSFFILVVLFSLEETSNLYFGFFFFFFTIIPSLILTTSGSTVAAADRYMYLPSIGLIYLLAVGFHYIYNKISWHQILKKIILSLLILSMVTSFSYAAYTRSLIWGNSEMLYLDTLSKYPNAIEANYNLGVIYEERGMTEPAIKRYKKAISLNENHFMANNKLKKILDEQKRIEKEEAAALRIKKVKEKAAKQIETKKSIAPLPSQSLPTSNFDSPDRGISLRSFELAQTENK